MPVGCVSVRNTYTLEQLLFVVVGPCVDTSLVLGCYLDFGLKIKHHFRNFVSPQTVPKSVLRYESKLMLTGCLPVSASGSRPFLRALCLNCCFCLSLSSFNCKQEPSLSTSTIINLYENVLFQHFILLLHRKLSLYLRRSPAFFASPQDRISLSRVWWCTPRVLWPSVWAFQHRGSRCSGAWCGWKGRSSSPPPTAPWSCYVQVERC